MTGHQLPIAELTKAIFARLDATISVTVATFILPNQARPYLEIGDMTWTDASYKDGYVKDVFTEFNIYSEDETLKEAAGIANTALSVLTGDVLALEGGFKVDNVQPDGGGEVRKEADSEMIYWRMTFRLRWRVRDSASIR